MLQILIQYLQSQPKVKTAVEQLFGQPMEHIAGCVGSFMDNVKKGPGLVNTAEQKLNLFNRIYQGGRALGFCDWEAELAAAKIAGYSDLDICISFRDRHKWPQTTVENIAALVQQTMPRFIEKAKAANLLPPEMFPQSGLPKTDVDSTGGVAPWETLLRPGADGNKVDNNAPNNNGGVS